MTHQKFRRLALTSFLCLGVACSRAPPKLGPGVESERCLGPHLEGVSAALRGRQQAYRYQHLLVMLRQLQLLTETIEATPAPAGAALCTLAQHLGPLEALGAPPPPDEERCQLPPHGAIVRSRTQEIVRGFLDDHAATSARWLAYEVAPRARERGGRPCECARRFLSGLQLAAADAIVVAPSAQHKKALVAFAVGVEGLVSQAEIVDEFSRGTQVNGRDDVCAALPPVRLPPRQ